RKTRPDMGHLLLFVAGLLGLTAAYALRIKKRIYTRHNAIYHIDDYPHMVKYDRYINAISTHIVAISDSVKKVMVDMEGANPDKITSIPHGFKLEAFEQPDKNRVEAMKMTYQTVGKHPVIGVVSRYTRWKGVHFIIEAFQELLKTHPNAYLVLANANGDYRQPIQQLLKRLPPDSFVEIPFEEDLYSLYQLFDIYVHVPIKPQAEAFGQTYVEALAAGIPSVVTLSGIACEFIKDQENAVVVNYEETIAIHNGILSLLDDKKLRDSIIKNGHEDVKKYFGLNKMITSLENLYEC
ncbi:MAG: glycosyltransferase family 4 protein, partial [Bacteroidota bacterium]